MVTVLVGDKVVEITLLVSVTVSVRVTVGAEGESKGNAICT